MNANTPLFNPFHYVEHLGIDDAKRKVLQFPLDVVDSETMRERRVYLERLLRDGDSLLSFVGLNRAHVVQTIGQLDQDHADILRHHQKHLAQILRLIVHHILERKVPQLGHSIDEDRWNFSV